MNGRIAGLTLVELLVAIAVFMIIGVAAYIGLFSVLETREVTDRRSARLADIQYAVGTLAEDVRQSVARPVRSDGPGRGHALAGDTGRAAFLRLTRTGWPNPANLPRASLARVTWALDGERLMRSWRMHPDAVLATSATRREMLDGVERVELRFLDETDDWRPRWPGLDTVESSARLPRALEITLELDDWGRLTRLFELPAGSATTARTTDRR